MQRPSFKPRELEILRLLAEGLTNPEIGARLHLAHDTVRWYNKHIFEKLDATNRLQAVQRAVERGCLPGPGEPTRAVPPPARPPVQYVANGEVHLAYQVVGHGPVDLLFIHGFLSHMELAWENPEYAQFFERLGRFARVILFDKRGVGLSDRIQGAPSLEMTMEDARCVLDAAGSQQAFILGTSEGGAGAVLFASTYPARVRGLILLGASAKIVQTNGEPAWAESETAFSKFIEDLQINWGQPWALPQFAPSRVDDAHFRAWWAMVLRAASSPSSIRAVLNVIRAVDIRPLLPQVRVRTLVLHKTRDQIVPVEAGRYLAAHLPNASFVELSGADHIYFVESDAILEALARFCQETPAPPETWLAIFLYLKTHEDTFNDLHSSFVPFQPKQVLSTPHGLLLTFDSPTRAVQCARALLQTPSRAILLHVGECSMQGNYPQPAVLETILEAATFAEAGELVLTRVLRDILAGSGYAFKSKRTPSMQLFTLR